MIKQRVMEVHTERKDRLLLFLGFRCIWMNRFTLCRFILKGRILRCPLDGRLYPRSRVDMLTKRKTLPLQRIEHWSPKL